MRKFFFSILLLTFPLQLFAADADTRTYLQRQSIDAWIVMARGAIGDPVYSASLQALSKWPANELSKFILALVANGMSPQMFLGHNYLNDLLAEVKQNQIGEPRLLNDDAWGLLALRAAGLPTEHVAVASVRKSLLLTQNTDGGWGYAISGKSDTNDTAAVMMALAEAGVSSLDPSLQRALGYLAREQNDDGGFSFDHALYPDSDAASDAWVISALQKVGSNPALFMKHGRNPIDHLRSLRLANGSYTWKKGGLNGEPTLTAWAVIALEGKSYPIRENAPPESPVPSVRPPEPAPSPSVVPWSGPLPGTVATSIASRKEVVQTVVGTPSSPTQDSDGDGYSDAVELQRGYDPHDPVPCPKVVYSTTLRNSYGGARLAHAENEACRARYLRTQLEKMLGKRLRLSSRAFTTFVQAYLYGGYDVKEIAMAVHGAKTVHPKIYRDLWVRRNR